MHTKKECLDKLKALGPYRKEHTEIVAGTLWYKVVDKNGVPLVNYDIAEDKADFICQCVNSQPKLLEACKMFICFIQAQDSPEDNTTAIRAYEAAKKAIKSAE